jgi:hypothetical protein
MISPESREDLRSRLANLLAKDVSALRTAYREAAAVLASFDLRTLQPVRYRADAAEAAAFSEDCEPSPESSGWVLEQEIRRETVRRLREEGRLGEARAANSGTPGQMQQWLDAALGLGPKPRGAEDSLLSLRHQLTISAWLEGVVAIRPATEIRAEISRLQLLEPFRELVGEHFAGRQKELAELNDYAGVFEASGYKEAATRGLEWVLNLHDRPPLFVCGPGGIGKSTLIAKFILDHARAADERERFPYAYLDFDRAALTPNEPVTLLLEALKQITIQRAEAAERGRRLEAEWRERMAKQDSVRRGGGGSGMFRLQNRGYYIDSFAQFIDSLRQDHLPLLLVLDTFEEVQYRAATYVSEVFRLLADVQKRIPRTRSVISGRDLPRVTLDDKPLKLRELRLGEFDETAASAFLQNRGVPSETAARQIVKQVGRSPLALRVAADLWKAEGGGEGIENLDYSFWDRLRGRRIETVLYTRILGHIRNERVRKLAHPGLVLRKVNAELILHVLAEPCGVDVATIEDAKALFAELRREFTLVTPDPSDAYTVVHRADVRTLMLGALRDAAPEQVVEIHRRAASYYSGRSGEADQAEEYYHRLSQGVDPSRMGQPEFPRLDLLLPMSAILELPPASQAFLASRLPIDVPDEVWADADWRHWEQYAMRRIREAQSTGSADATRFLNSPPKHVPKNVEERLRQLAGQDARRSAAAARLAEGLREFDEESLKKLLAAVTPSIPKFDSLPELTQRALAGAWLDALAAAALSARPGNRSLFAAAQELGLTSLSDETLRQIEAASGEDGERWDLNVWRERLGVVERQVCLVRWGGAWANGFLIGPGFVLLPRRVGERELPAGGDVPQDIELVFDHRQRLEGATLAGHDLALVAASPELGCVVLRGYRLESRGSIPIATVTPVAGAPVILVDHPRGDRMETRLERLPALGKVGGAPCLDRDFRVFAMSLSRGSAVPLATILHWLAEQRSETAALCSPEFGLRLMTDIELEPRPEVRAAMGRALGTLGLDTRMGVGVKVGVPDIDWVLIRGEREKDTFHMSRYPVTNAQYEAFLGAEDGYRQDRWWDAQAVSYRRPAEPEWREPNHPRETVSWYEAMAFCEWLSYRLGYQVRLPSEREWERAARFVVDRSYPWGDEYKAGYANINETCEDTRVGPHYLGRTSPVGIYPQGASKEGVMDLAGNVWEWCLDEYEPPMDPRTRAHVARGGSWQSNVVEARAAERFPKLPHHSRNVIGFRVVCTSPVR